MGSEAEPEPSPTPKLPLFTIPPPTQSPYHSGMLTPPLQTSASVPFRWEEQPGKPRPCTALITTTLSQDPNNKNNTIGPPPPKCLELPPRLQLMDYSKMTKMPSPTTVLDGPYIFQSSSFRFKRECQWSFGSPERGQLGAMVLSKRPEKKERGGLFGSWGIKRGGKKEVVGEGSFVLSSSLDIADFGADHEKGSSKRVKMSRIRRHGSFSSLSQARSHFWATIYEGFKQVLPWGSKKPRNEGLSI